MGSVRREAVAIIGMSCRVPGAMGIEAFWRNLRDGVESIGSIPDKMIEARRNVDGQLPPNFVGRGSYLKDTELFDHSFFGLSLRDAKIMDPQQRLFIEHVWTAIEDAGYDPQRLGERVAVIGGGGPSRHILDAFDYFGHDPSTLFEVVATGSANAMVMRASYLLDLKGESTYIYTACSTTLVAIDMACRTLLDHRADVAIAGGTALWLPQQEGYEYVEGMILSSDGRCRAFDAKADGTVWGNGVGVVVLKRLDEALRDRDPIRALVVGSWVNNDGRQAKASFAAPSAVGQADAIQCAYEEAGIDLSTVTFIEAHGTGTTVGDPLEVEGLHRVFGKGSGPGTCALGSVKTNIGHLDPVAGIASVIKTVLSLEHRQIPASLHFTRPNPAIDFSQGPFFVNTELRPWETRGGPRRAGVNSFGVGGTNAHIILEEAPPLAAAVPSPRPRQLVTLSARSATALAAMTEELRAHLEQHPGLDLADVAFTRSLGRRQHDVRRAIVAADVAALSAALAHGGQASTRPVAEGAKLSFVFPGQGSQHPRMAQELYEAEPDFRQDVDDCTEVLESALGRDLREVLFPASGREAWATDELRQTALTQPALFVIEYTLARQWMRWGLRPEAMLGHSVGEYVAACLAGVFHPADALLLVAERGRLTQAAPRGSMLAVPLSESELAPRLQAGIDLAAINGPRQCVVSGPDALIADLEGELAAEGIEGSRLHTSHAFHSSMLQDAADAFEAEVRQTKLKPPQIPYLSNVTGTWITAQEATEPQYWARHLRAPVRFWDCLSTLRASGRWQFIEVGPGHVLTGLLSQERPPGEVVFPSLRHPTRGVSDYDVLFKSLGELWSRHAPVDWESFYAHEQRRRVSLPHYPFDKAWCALYEPGEEFKLVEKALGGRRLGAAPGEVTPPPGGAAAEPRAEGAIQERPASYHRPYVAPRGEIETRIAELFGRSLGVQGLGADDHFLDFGAHSLMLVPLSHQLRVMFNVKIGMRLIYENPTPAQLAQAIQRLIAEREAEEKEAGER